MEEVKKIYIKVADIVKSIEIQNKYNQDAGILKKLNMSENDVLFEDWIKYLLQSEEFYRALFYKDILLVEGENEKIILKKAYKNISDNSYFLL